MSNRSVIPYVLAIGLLILLVAPLSFGAAADRGGNRGGPDQVPNFAIIQFADPSVSEYAGGIPGYLKTKADPGKHLDLTSPAAQAYDNFLSNSHANFRAWMHTNVALVEVVREYSVVFNGMAVQLNGVAPDTLRGAPGVVDVAPDWLYQPSMDVSVPLIHAPAVWSTLGVDLSGTPDYGNLANIKVGVVDTGVLDTHPFIASCRADNPVVHRGPYFSGLPFGTTIVADHGTHVAGTIGGCKIEGPVNVGSTNLALAPASGTTLGFLSGVAPGVTLYDYNVFPGMGVGYYILQGSAFSHDIAAAVEQAVIDGMDVINLSIGGGVQGPHDMLADALNAAVDAGVVAAVAAGNSGPGTLTIESPGSAANVITAGASTDPHYMGISVKLDDAAFGGLQGTTVGAAVGQFANYDPAMTGNIANTVPANGCTAITNDVSGKIAVINRGVCTFGTKIQNAQDAGAAGAIIVNNVFGDPISMGADGVHNPTIPAAMVSNTDGATLAAHDGAQITADGTTIVEVVTSNSDYLAGFSSRGPTPYTFLIKPDVTAPGVNVLSSVFSINPDGTYAPSYAFFQGTSMATPHTTGSAALLLAAHPDWSPAQVKSALVNNADRPVKSPSNGAALASPLSRGGGRINVWSADNTPATLYPASVSFGVFTGGKPVNGAMSVAFHDETGSGLTCALSVVSATSGTWVSVSPATLSVPSGGTAWATVTLSGGQSIGTGFFFGDVVAGCGSTTLRAPWFVGVQRSNGGLNGNLHGGLSDVDAMPSELVAEMTGTNPNL
ncbi:MAG TPA: S8 family serine peptidase [Thermoplasmata archaeon]|nr:S8 family serine peptidase [Thermoplasmata archaeon]